MAHFWQLFVRPPGGGPAWPPSSARGGAARGGLPRVHLDAPVHARRPGARPALLRARGLDGRPESRSTTWTSACRWWSTGGRSASACDRSGRAAGVSRAASSRWSARWRRGREPPPAEGDRVQLGLEPGGARLADEQRAATAARRPACRARACRARRGWRARAPRRPGATARARSPRARRRGAAGAPPPRSTGRAAPGTRCGGARAGRARRRTSRARRAARRPGPRRRRRARPTSSRCSTIAGLRSAPVMRHAGRGNRWRPGCQPQPTDSTSPPASPSRRSSSARSRRCSWS